jgi:hypothetical protein
MRGRPEGAVLEQTGLYSRFRALWTDERKDLDRLSNQTVTFVTNHQGCGWVCKR